MILKRLKIKGYGPFYEEQTLEIDPNVTVLTGANDVGKSALLSVLNHVTPTNDGTSASREDVNEDLILRSGSYRQALEDLHVIATFQLLAESNVPETYGGELDTNWPAENVLLANVSELRDSSGNQVDFEEYRSQSYSRVIDLGISDRIRRVLDQGTINPIEHTFLEFAFDSADVWNDLSDLPRRAQDQRLNQANTRLKEGLALYKLESLSVDLSLGFESYNPVRFVVEVQDRYGGFAGPQLRGLGYQKLLALMFHLLAVQPSDDQHVILIIDEPENSLHADAQHSFRRMLESFAESPLIQIIYATHSPAMINPARPKSLRLLYRESTNDGVATTRIDNKPYIESNFQSVRGQLGVLPADSLMYASITVIVEGPTERLALNSLIAKIIRESKEEQHEGLNLLWRLSFVVSAGGSENIPYWIEFAKGQGVKPVVLVDGDKIREAEKWRKDFDDVEIFYLDEGDESEDLVPRDVYIEALAEVLAEAGKSSEKITEAEFDRWWKGSGQPEQMMFSKQVDKWLRSEFDTCLDKPKVMDKAVELAEFNSLKLDNINDVITAIRRLANDPN